MFKKISGVLLLSLMSAFAQAGGGSAMIPHWITSGAHTTTVFIVNITNAPVDVHVDLTTSIGGTFAGGTTLSNFSGNPLTGFASIAPQNTAFVYIPSAATTALGHGMIDWQTSGPDKIALTASVLRSYRNNATGETSETMIPVNNYEPF